MNTERDVQRAREIAEAGQRVNGKVLIGLQRAVGRLQGIRNQLQGLDHEEAAWGVQAAIDALLALEPKYKATEIVGARIEQLKWVPETHREEHVEYTTGTLLRQIGEAARKAGAVEISREPAAKMLRTADPEDIKVTIRCAVIAEIEPEQPQLIPPEEGEQE